MAIFASSMMNFRYSIRPVCDEIVVVDTGSTDDTVAVAESFGAVVAHRPWDDDFAAARNRALDLATGEWILYIDADEQLEDLERGPGTGRSPAEADQDRDHGGGVEHGTL